ncbi:MAG: DNA-directed RNA polymerase subunit omega, partial [Candidatus Pelagibacter sp.]|nr:DNA-directed RNA polymerase subunit omega [Candidatus Pelagibacter sp.]
IQVAPEDLEELTAKAEPEVDVDTELEVGAEDTEVSLDQISETETTEVNSDDSETTNS